MEFHSMVFMPVSELRKVIREEVEAELQKVPYYSQGSNPNKILSLEQAAAYCGICTRTLVSRVHDGKLKSGGTGRNYRFRIGDLDAFMFN